MTNQATIEQIIALEQSLLNPETRGNRQQLSMLLADDFTEFGSSGTIYTKHSMISGLLANPDPSIAQLQVADISVRLLSGQTALVTYRIEADNRSSLRSSIWTCKTGNWQILFHQGTRTG